MYGANVKIQTYNVFKAIGVGDEKYPPSHNHILRIRILRYPALPRTP